MACAARSISQRQDGSAGANVTPTAHSSRILPWSSLSRVS
jgi:hypothetical protein